MNDHIVREAAEHMFRSACDYQGLSLQFREKCNEVFRANESSEQNSLRIAIDGLVAALGARIDKPISKVSPEASYQIGLTASFVRTYFLVTDMLMHGDLVEALVLIRKQIESLARLIELESASVRELEGKTPNIKHVLINGSGRMYGHLSEIAHFATPYTASFLGVNRDGERVGPSMVPIFQESLLVYMEAAQFTGLRFAQWMLGKLREWYPDENFDLEFRIAYIAIQSALKAGVIEEPEDVVA